MWSDNVIAIEMETNVNQKVSCIVNYAYEASEPDELTIRPGDVVREVEKLPGGWWRGELRGRRGMFPDNFVSQLTADHANNRAAGVQGRCRAVFSYQPANPDELPLAVGDVLDVLGEVEEGWWQGRRQGRVGVFPSNFVVMLDPLPVVPTEPAPALPPKPVKEQCRVLFPYSAVNEDELNLLEGDIVTVVSKEAPDRGWWRGELRGRVGLFPDNFVQLLPTAVTQDVEEKKPDRPPSKTNAIYPVLNKYSEKTASVKELSTSKTSLHKENTLSKESTTQSTITHTNKSESEKLIHSETVTDGTLDGQKKPPVPMKKSPTPTSGVGGLFSGLKSKILTSNDKEKDREKEKSPSSGGGASASSSNSSGEWDRADGVACSRPAAAAAAAAAANNNTFDHVERNSILNDPRAGRVKAPRRRPRSQVLRDDSLQQIGLSNGHEGSTGGTGGTGERPSPSPEKAQAEEIKPRANAREWEKHRAPWMEELKLSQAKKTSFGESKSRSVSGGDATAPAPAAVGAPAATHATPARAPSADRLLECGLDEKRSTHSMEMSKSTSSISTRMSVLESFEETKVRHSLDLKKDSEPPAKPAVQSPTAAGRTLSTMLDDIKKPPAHAPPAAFARTHTAHGDAHNAHSALNAHNDTHAKPHETKHSGAAGFDKLSTLERIEKEERIDKASGVSEKASALERRSHSKMERVDNSEALIAQLNDRITILEKLVEVQNAKFSVAIESLTAKLAAETDRRQALQAELEKLAHCVTQV